MHHATLARVDYLERSIAETHRKMDILQNRPLGQSIASDFDKLRKRAATIQCELHEIRPYQSFKIGEHYLVAYHGNFVTEPDGEWLKFASDAAAQNWISQQIEVTA